MRLLFVFVFLSSFAFNTNGQKILKNIKEGNESKVFKWLLDGTECNKKFSINSEEGIVFDVHVIEYAAFFNKKKILDLFIQEKEIFNNYKEWISDALSANIHNCDIETIKKLLNAGASVNKLCNMCLKASPIAVALKYNCTDIYKLLIENKAKLTNKGSGFDVIHVAAAEKSVSIETLKDLVENYGLDVNQIAANGMINAAFFAGNIKKLQYLIKKGVNYEALDSDGCSILYHHTNDFEMFAYLDDLLRNQKSFSKDQVTNKNSPLIFNVIADDNKEVFDYYIKNYSEYININDAKGNSPIFQLLYTKINTEYFLTELLKFNLDLNAKDEFGKNLKFHAKKMKNKELLEIINEIN